MTTSRPSPTDRPARAAPIVHDLRNVSHCEPAASGRKLLAQSVLSTSNIELYDPESLPVFQALRSSVHWCVYGGSCYSYGRLASGGIDIAIDRFTTPHDVLAHVPVITNAGGVITDWDGAPLTLHSSGHCLAAANAELHQAALRRIAVPRAGIVPAA
ncbi:inositol monophosphatase family protein [Bosea sp. F3-2]|uniref:inositol monophosphatase family protein n=1 Tax=Bosea sp. F3-2 TaxID=2599640 RepID=UPI001655B8FD|nr:inositol monophosphatase family protein [Bosea sp. F3-2]